MPKIPMSEQPSEIGQNSAEIIDTVPGFIPKVVGDVAVNALIDVPNNESEPFSPDFSGLFTELDKIGGILNDPEQRLSLVKDVSREDLLSAFDLLHRFLSPPEAHEALQTPAVVERKVVPIHRQEKVERVVNQLFIDPKDRDEFLDYFQERMASVDSADQAADMLAFTILNLHMYKDGNGRTARFIHEIMRNGYDGSDEAKKRIQEFATPRELVTGPRPMSFTVENVLKQVAIDKLAGNTDAEINKKFEHAVTFEDTYGMNNVSASIVESWLSSIGDSTLRTRLVKVLQQSDFGPYAMREIFTITEEKAGEHERVDVLMRLASIDDLTAQRIVESDRELRKEYMKIIVGIAAGDEIQTTNEFTGEQEKINAKGLAMSTVWRKAYIKEAA